MMSGQARTLSAARIAVMGVVFAMVLSLALTPSADAQQMRYTSGQNVVPVYEGWERNADGTFTMVFGYMNRNYEEEVDVPVGTDNRFEPVEPDQGQPAHFYPRRQQFMFKVRVPKDWGQKDLVWTLTSHGKTEKAFGTLTPFWEIDNKVYQQNRGGPGDLNEPDEAPTVSPVGPAQRAVRVGENVSLDVQVSDDGLPTFRPSRSGSGRWRRRSEAPRGTPGRQNPLTQAVVRLDRTSASASPGSCIAAAPRLPSPSRRSVLPRQGRAGDDLGDVHVRPAPTRCVATPTTACCSRRPTSCLR